MIPMILVYRVLTLIASNFHKLYSITLVYFSHYVMDCTIFFWMYWRKQQTMRHLLSLARNSFWVGKSWGKGFWAENLFINLFHQKIPHIHHKNLSEPYINFKIPRNHSRKSNQVNLKKSKRSSIFFSKHI